MAKKTTRLDVKELKARRQKKLAAGLGALLIVVVAIQGVRMKSMSGGSTPPAPAAAAATPAGTAATPAGDAASGASPTAAPTSLSDSDVAPTRNKSQLLTFEHFKSKDPFVQQVSDQPPPTAATPASADTAATPSAATPTAATPTDTAPTSAMSPAATPAAGSTGSSATYSTAAKAKPTARRATRKLAAAVVEVNGERQSVVVAATFPKANPTFKLVSMDNGIAKIGIAGGNYASGAETVALRLGRTLTLVNTADRKRYELRLVSAP